MKAKSENKKQKEMDTHSMPILAVERATTDITYQRVCI